MEGQYGIHGILWWSGFRDDIRHHPRRIDCDRR